MAVHLCSPGGHFRLQDRPRCAVGRNIWLARAEELLKELGLRRAAEAVVNHADAAAAQQLTYLAFLVGLLEVERSL